MAIDWDAEVLAPVMSVFGEGAAADQSTLPLYMPLGEPPFRLPDAVFDSAYQQVTELADGSQGTTQHPVLGVRGALFIGLLGRLPLQNDSVLIPSTGKVYGVVDPQPDGHGHLKLILIETGQ